MRRHYLFIVFTLLLAFFLRIHHLANWVVWWDEAWSVWVAKQPFMQATESTARDIHPPVYQWLLFVWVRLVGSSEFAVRLLSVFAGMITISTVYALTNRLSKQRLAASIAMVLIAVSVFHIHWSQETRMYALAAMFTGVLVYAYLRGWWLLLIVSGVGVSLSHYLGAFSVVILNLHMLIFRRENGGKWRRWFILMAVIGVIWLLWAIYAIGLIRTDGGPAQFDPVFAFQIVATLFAVGQSTSLDAYILPTLVITFIYLFGVGLVWRNNRTRHTVPLQDLIVLKRKSVVLVLLASLLPPLVITLLSVPFNPFYAPAPEERYFVIFAPIVFAGFGLGLTAIIRWYRPVGMLVCAGLFVVYGMTVIDQQDKRYFKDDYASMMAAVSVLTQPDDLIFFTSGGRFPLVYYNLERVDYTDFDNLIGIAGLADDVPVMMEDTFASVSRFWLIEIEAHLDEPQGARMDWINAHYERVYHIPVAYNGISLYSKDANEPVPISGAIVAPVVSEARPGDVVRIGVPSDTAVELVYNGHVIETQQADSWQLLQFAIYPAYPSGEYALRIGNDTYPFSVTHSQETPKNIENNINTILGNMTLLGYKLKQSGASLDLTLNWQADERMDINYTVFAQLIGPFNPETNGPLWSQDDGYPAQTPTTLWWPGLVAYDHRILTVPQSAPNGDYMIVAGLYSLNTGERVLTPDGEDHVVLRTINYGK